MDLNESIGSSNLSDSTNVNTNNKLDQCTYEQIETYLQQQVSKVFYLN